MNVNNLMTDLERKHPGESEYLQAVREVLESIEGIYNQHPEFEKAKIVERIVEPDRIFTFRVTWVDDKGDVQTNLGYRVQFNSAIGPYKGGLRFHKAVNPSMLKFLGFGQAFMTELWNNIGVDTDVPAGDVGVGGREIGFLNGMYQKLARKYHTGVLTGKGMTWGGSVLRPEATGFGALYFVEHMLRLAGKSLKGATVAISGFGNVAWGAATKATELGAKVIAISGPDGVIYNPNGMTPEKIAYMLDLRASNRNIVAPFAEKFSDATFTPGKKAWSVKCDIALPCAFQNELNGDDAAELLKNGTWCCAEVSNMGCTPEAIHAFQKAGILFAPGKAVNAGGVATSGLEMTVGQRGGREAPLHHGKHPRGLREIRQTGRRSYRLRQGCQHRRLHESGPRDARAGYHLTNPVTEKILAGIRPGFFLLHSARRSLPPRRRPIRPRRTVQPPREQTSRSTRRSLPTRCRTIHPCRTVRPRQQQTARVRS